MPQRSPDEEQVRTLTLEAFADTIVPGEKRSPGDRAIAGVSAGGGAVAAGALELLEWSASGIDIWLDDLVGRLNEHAEAYVAEQGLPPDGSVPAFVALS